MAGLFRLDRFGPNYVEREARGTVNVTPLKRYEMILPMSKDLTHGYAPWFEHDLRMA